MELKHYLEYLQNTIVNKWDSLAMKDLDGATSYTYGGLANEIARLHVTFRELGIKEGDKVALCGRNCANWGLIFLAIETYKAVAVSILPDFTAEGVHALVNHSEAKLLYAGPNVLKKIDAKEMHRQGFVFGKTENEVWCTEIVPTEFIAEKIYRT